MRSHPASLADMRLAFSRPVCCLSGVLIPLTPWCRTSEWAPRAMRWPCWGCCWSLEGALPAAGRAEILPWRGRPARGHPRSASCCRCARSEVACAKRGVLAGRPAWRRVTSNHASLLAERSGRLVARYTRQAPGRFELAQAQEQASCQPGRGLCPGKGGEPEAAVGSEIEPGCRIIGPGPGRSEPGHRFVFCKGPIRALALCQEGDGLHHAWLVRHDARLFSLRQMKAGGEESAIAGGPVWRPAPICLWKNCWMDSAEGPASVSKAFCRACSVGVPRSQTNCMAAC